MSSEENFEVNNRLSHWAAWIIRIEMGEEGWPTDTILERIRREGFLVHDNTSRKSSEPFCSPRAEEINTLINQLRVIDRKIADALYYYYLTKKYFKDAAGDLGIHPRTFRKRVKLAKKWLAERLDK